MNFTWANIFKKAGLIRSYTFFLFCILGIVVVTEMYSQELQAISGRAIFEKLFWFPFAIFFFITFLTIALAEISKKRRKITSLKPVFVTHSNLVDRGGLGLVFLIAALLGWLLGVCLAVALIK